MNDITFGQAWAYGGFLMWVLAGLSVAALGVVLYLLVMHSAMVCVPLALKRIRAAKDPEAEGGHVADRMMSAVDWLADIAAVAPLVGLLGTVLGMFQAFGGIASDVSAGALLLAWVLNFMTRFPRTGPQTIDSISAMRFCARRRKNA